MELLIKAESKEEITKMTPAKDYNLAMARRLKKGQVSAAPSGMFGEEAEPRCDGEILVVYAGRRNEDFIFVNGTLRISAHPARRGSSPFSLDNNYISGFVGFGLGDCPETPEESRLAKKIKNIRRPAA